MAGRKPAVLVTGGAGYIGSHAVRELWRAGFRPIAYDNLSEGHRPAVRHGELVRGDLASPGRLLATLKRFRVRAVMHVAANCLVGESVADPAKYYRNNLVHTFNLLGALRAAKVGALVFSSTAAVYGEPERTPIPEDAPARPINPYGETKWAGERMIGYFGDAHGLRSVSLRYFNASGADEAGDLGEDHDPETHLVPVVLRAALAGAPVTVHGNDYPTRDGTCVRDYVHVSDLADAHVLALRQLLDGAPGGAYNLGNGTGYTVQEVLDQAREVTGREIATRVGPRRPGDPAVLVASSEKAVRELGWKPRRAALRDIVETAWRWHESHPNGYGKAK
jgi:UDP-glucose-4-epimerase GalE